MSVCCECCVLSGRGLCVGLITRPEESYRLWCVVVCGREASIMRPWPIGGEGIKVYLQSMSCPLPVTDHIAEFGVSQQNFSDIVNVLIQI